MNQTAFSFNSIKEPINDQEQSMKELLAEMDASVKMATLDSARRKERSEKAERTGNYNIDDYDFDSKYTPLDCQDCSNRKVNFNKLKTRFKGWEKKVYCGEFKAVKERFKADDCECYNKGSARSIKRYNDHIKRIKGEI